MINAKHELRPVAVADRGDGISRPEDAAAAFADKFDDRREAFLALYLDSRHRPLAAAYVVSVGSVNASLVHPREVFRPAVEVGAVAMIVAHNHPSGDPRPSADDLELTKRLAGCGELMGIALLDHLVMGEGETVSVREHGWPGGSDDF